MNDLFNEKITEIDINIVFETLNYRYLNRLPMQVSTEIKVEELRKGRIYDFGDAGY
jgi:hypothetical protein